jgi:hypothetical protein
MEITFKTTKCRYNHLIKTASSWNKYRFLVFVIQCTQHSPSSLVSHFTLYSGKWGLYWCYCNACWWLNGNSSFSMTRHVKPVGVRKSQWTQALEVRLQNYKNVLRCNTLRAVGMATCWMVWGLTPVGARFCVPVQTEL